MRIIIVLGVAYLLGAIPWGVVIARYFYKVEISQLGSKNTGATNVWRTLGRKAGMATLALDIFKGSLAVLFSKWVLPSEGGTAIAAGFISIIGHNYSIFLKGRGGKGVATSAGVFLALAPLQALIALVVFLGFFLKTKHVSVGSIAGATALFISSLVIPTLPLLRLVILLASSMILIKHVPNMKRLAKGEEPKVNFP